MKFSKENLRNNTGELFESFGATLIKDNRTGKELWYVPDESLNTLNDSKEIEYFGTFAEDDLGLYLYSYKALNRHLWVETGDTIVVNFSHREDGKSVFKVENLTKDCHCLINQDLGDGIIDRQDRRDILLSLAHAFKDVPCVKFLYYLTYTDEQFLNYIELSDAYCRV